MKALSKTYLTVFLFCCSFSIVSAQDVIHKNSGEEVEAKILEIGVDEIKYKAWDNQEGPLYAIDKNSVRKIVFENGKTEFFHDQFEDPEAYADQRKHDLKINFLSPLYGHTDVIYERLISPGRSFEARIGFVGLGRNSSSFSYNGQEYKRDPKGAYLSASYKFFNKPDFYQKGMRYSHVLRGKYIRPELVLGSYSENVRLDGSAVENRTVVFGGLMLNFGKQWVFSDMFLVDFYVGLGYGVDNHNNESVLDDFVSHNFAFTKFGSDTSFAIGGGLRVGFLLK